MGTLQDLDWARYRIRAGHVTGFGLDTLQDLGWARYRIRTGHVTVLGLDTLQDLDWALGFGLWQKKEYP